ncbi:MAG TPA: molybdopterin-dependent oxidoreductase, partial [Synergistales bacterium]|nr:molybdopterin-dependent oxidoreductase [Synergistales bacterium]
VKTTCNKCPLGCELDLNLERSRQRITRITTDLDNPASPTHGHCCVKGRYEFNDVWEDRLLTPAMKGEELSWTQALDTLTGIMKDATPSETAFISSASLTNEEYRALKSFLQGWGVEPFFAATDMDSFAPGLAVLKERTGVSRGTASYDAIHNADCFLLTCTNTDDEQPVFSSWIRRAMRKNGASLVYVGEDAGMLDKGRSWVFPAKKGSEKEVLKGLQAAILTRENMDIPHDLAPYVPDKIAALTGVSGELYLEAAKALLSAKKLVTLLGAEVASSPSATEDACAIMDVLEKKDLFVLYREANTQGLINTGITNTTLLDTIGKIRSGEVRNLILLDVAPSKVGLGDALPELENVVYIGSTRLEEKEMQDLLALPKTCWAEQAGTFINLNNTSVSLNPGPVTAGNSKNLTWILSGTARRLAFLMDPNILSY